MAEDADAARKERMADYRVGGRHLVHLGPDVLSRDAMQKERALTPGQLLPSGGEALADSSRRIVEETVSPKKTTRL